MGCCSSSRNQTETSNIDYNQISPPSSDDEESKHDFDLFDEDPTLFVSAQPCNSEYLDLLASQALLEDGKKTKSPRRSKDRKNRGTGS
jgi:hypothetical protein